jgi:hypothetical protein
MFDIHKKSELRRIMNSSWSVDKSINEKSGSGLFRSIITRRKIDAGGRLMVLQGLAHYGFYWDIIDAALSLLEAGQEGKLKRTG